MKLPLQRFALLAISCLALVSCQSSTAAHHDPADAAQFTPPDDSGRLPITGEASISVSNDVRMDRYGQPISVH